MSLLGEQRLFVRGSNGMTLPVHLIAFDIEQFYPEAFVVTGITCPPSVARSVHSRQAEFYFGRLAARSVLAVLDAPHGEVGVGISREPMWPLGIVGSISHTNAIAAAAALRRDVCSGVGVDIEVVAKPEACAALMATVISDQELNYLQTLVAVLPMNTLLTAVFSAKESLFKGAYNAVGRYFDFTAARVVWIDMERQSILLQLTETLCDAFVYRQLCEIGLSLISPDIVMTSYVW
jgi:4'-phosphopantetheinyl transferase EntD